MKTCSSKYCSRKHYAKGLCRAHYARTLTGNTDTGPIKYNPGEWGDWYETQNGYIQRMRRVPHPDGGRGYKERQYQHRVVMEEMLGRPLLPEENVHHKNGDRKDNRPENLELWSTSQPPGQRVERL